MAEKVDAQDIERIVGATRHPTQHQARAVSAEQTVYILHSQECLDSGIDLLDCHFTWALDNGIREHEWPQDAPVTVVIVGVFGHTRLVPAFPVSSASGVSS